MATTFIFQGFTASTHGDAVRRIFGCPDLERVLISVAFLNESGVNLIAAEIKRAAGFTTVYAGIRNNITSRQGLEALLAAGAKVYAVDTGGRRPLYHPKLFYGRGTASARLVIGSANLTVGGLNDNIEAGFAVDLDLANEADLALSKSVEDQLDALPAEFPENVLLVSSAADLDLFQSTGRLLDETEVVAPTPVTTAKNPAADTVPKIKLKVPRLPRTVQAGPAAAVPALPAAAPAAPAAPPVAPPVGAAPPVAAAAAQPPAAPAAVPPAPVAVTWEAVWESKALTERDLNVPTGVNTHVTGSINLDKGQLPPSLDQRHYFRDNVFSALTWRPARAPMVEQAVAKFQLVVKGVQYGEFTLRIGHSTDVTSRTYQQNNAMTRLSWGPMKGYVAQPTLIGRTLTLHRAVEDPTRFLIEID